MEKIKNIPKLRFPEFSGEWEKKKLKKIFSIFNGYAFSSNDTVKEGVLWVKIADVGIQEMKTDNLSYLPSYLLEKHEKFVLKKGDFVIALTRPILNGRLKIAQINDFFNNSLLNQRVGKIESKNNLNFIYTLLQNDWLIKSIDNNIAGSDPPNLSPNEINSIQVSIPSLPEQTKIASFLTSVDEKLQALKKEKELLEKYKKGVMQKIFSLEIRFKDDSGNEFPEWEEKKLGEVANVKRGASPRPITNPIWFCNDSNIGWVRISDVTKSNKFLEKTEQYLSEEGIKKSRLVHKGNLIMSICATIGKPIYTNFDVCIHDGFVVFEELKLNKEYLYYYLDMIKMSWYKYGQPGTQINLNSEIVSNEIILFPCLAEQIKIANFLSAIDDKINNCSNQIEKMEAWKRGLLQQMFV